MTDLFFLVQDMNPFLRSLFLVLFFVGMFLVVFSQVFVYMEQQYAERYFKPLFFYPIIRSRPLDDRAINILNTRCDFYQKLSKRLKRRFRHRLVTLLSDLHFETRDELELTDEMRVLIVSTAVTMTFGFRNYRFPNLETIVLYPGPYYSEWGNEVHKGEYSPARKTLIFSWEDYLKGYEVANDNLNLGIHEFSHVIHLKCHFSSDISAQIYNMGLIKLKYYLKENEGIRQRLLDSEYVRSYAFNNEVEFIAVLTECFFETPVQLKEEFPFVYQQVQNMLNLRYDGY
jgi:Mlc titration factor MtfA (ptsG expression regulator)